MGDGLGRSLRITHRSGYRYDNEVHASFNEVRMTPADDAGQALLRHELRVSPGGAVFAYEDYWGAVVESFDVHEPHRLMEVVAVSTVETRSGHLAASGLTWTELGHTSVLDRWCEYLMATGYVDDALVDGDRAELVASCRALPTPRDAIRAVVAGVHERMSYTPGVTSVFTTAGEAWVTGQGVCQDFAHSCLSLLRALGVPARYVSGYLHTEDPAIGATVIGESHAWVEAWDGGWEAFDPTNDREVASAHVKVAAGRDYRDVPPLKGLYGGGGSEALAVTVEITQMEC